MKYLRLALLGAFATGCVASNGLQYDAASETNLYHIAKIRKGMSEKQVLQIMHRPYSYETFQVDDDVYDVWFYVTKPTGLDQTRMVPQNLTPLTFKNGTLVGTGYYWYYYAMKAEAEEAAKMASETQSLENSKGNGKSQDTEDIEFEKALKTFPERPTPPPLQPAPPPAPSKIPSQSPTQMSMGPAICPPAKNLSQLAKGMTETQVFRVMGAPIRYQTFEIGRDVYDVWFYETVPNKTGKPSIIPQHLTPITFKNASLLSMSEDVYFDLKEKADQQIAHLPPPPTPEAPPVDLALPKPTEVSPIAEPFSFLKPWKPHSPFAVTQRALSKVQVGMSEAEVTNLLGPPSHFETFQLDGNVYDVWFYETPPSRKTPTSQIVPLTFKNSVLTSMAREDYEKIKEAAEKEKIDCYDKEGERMQEDASDQNFNFW